eukprot:Partr_v1_DN25273_c0_g1_i1_m16524 putative Ring finger protein 220
MAAERSAKFDINSLLNNNVNISDPEHSYHEPDYRKNSPVETPMPSPHSHGSPPPSIKTVPKLTQRRTDGSYLQSPRDRPRRVQPLKCPVCNDVIPASKIEMHYQLELAIILDESRLPDNLASSSSKRPVRKVSARKTMDVRKHKIRRQLESFRRNKQKRENAMVIAKSSERDNVEPPQTYNCCVCGDDVIGSLHVINAHVDACLDTSANHIASDAEDNNDEFETYEWAGETRVRVISGVDAPLSGLGYSASKSEDVADILDVDGDDEELYGAPQFTSTNVPNSLSMAQSRGDSSIAGDESTVIKSLTARICELESKNNYQCLICMDEYSTPLTSIICWHVHCQNCWLETLAHKKLCPQCNVITAPQDLRKIYL